MRPWSSVEGTAGGMRLGCSTWPLAGRGTPLCPGGRVPPLALRAGLLVEEQGGSAPFALVKGVLGAWGSQNRSRNPLVFWSLPPAEPRGADKSWISPPPPATLSAKGGEMPNWVTNKLVVTGPEDDLRTFRLKAEGPNPVGKRVPLTYHAFIPYPEEYARIDRLFYEWEQLTENRWAGVGSPEFQEFARKRGFDPAPERDGFNLGGYEWRIEKLGDQVGCYGPRGGGDRRGSRLPLPLPLEPARTSHPSHVQSTSLAPLPP